MKKWIGLTILIIVAILIWHFALPAEKYINQLPQEIKNFASSSLISLQNVKESVFAPPPLKGGSLNQNPKAALTVSGTISETNKNRLANGSLPALKENPILNLAAQNKLKDLFSQQYFEHENLQGKGPADVAKEVGYEYISIGENLALGNFNDDKDLVTAWMNSPGHRANILNKSFQEIGVAVGQGVYKGQKTWIAVQEFGKSKSSCPIVNTSLKGIINRLQAEISSEQTSLLALKSQIDAANPGADDQYIAHNKKVNEYNDLVHQFNNKVDTLKLNTHTYNSQVATFNACLGG